MKLIPCCKISLLLCLWLPSYKGQEQTVFLERGYRGIVPCNPAASLEYTFDDLEGVYWYFGQYDRDHFIFSYFHGALYQGDGIPERTYGISSHFGLVIQNVTDLAEGTYYYKVEPKLGRIYQGSAEVAVKVTTKDPFPVVPECDLHPAEPADICIVGVSDDTMTVSLTCEVSSAKPAVDIQWFRVYEDGHSENIAQTLKMELPNHKPGSFVANTYTSSSSIHLPTTGEDNTRYRCEAYGVALGARNGSHIVVSIRKSAEIIRKDGPVFLERGRRGIIPSPLDALPAYSMKDLDGVYWYFGHNDRDNAIMSHFQGTIAPLNGIPKGLFNISSDFGLIIQSVADENEGMYYFLVVPKVGKLYQGSVEVAVKVITELPFPVVSECDPPPSGPAGTCTVHIPHDTATVNLTCSVYYTKPPVTIQWSRVYDDGRIEHAENAHTTKLLTLQPGSLVDNTFTSLSSIQVQLTGNGSAVYRCEAYGVALGEKNGSHLLATINKDLPLVNADTSVPTFTWNALCSAFVVVMVIVTLAFVLGGFILVWKRGICNYRRRKTSNHAGSDIGTPLKGMRRNSKVTTSLTVDHEDEDCSNENTCLVEDTSNEEILDTTTLLKIARDVRNSWMELALFLSYGIEKCQAIHESFLTLEEQASLMLATWRHYFVGLNPLEYLARALATMGYGDLARELAPQKELPECSCANGNALRYISYLSKGDEGKPELLGICCTKCGQEWLQERFLFHPDTDKFPPSVKVCGVVLKKQLQVPMQINLAFLINCSRKKIDQFSTDGYNLKVGDHIAWRHYWGYWHHAVVSEIDPKGDIVKVIHWSKVGCAMMRITENALKLSKEQGELFRVDYPSEIRKINPPELVIARARSRLDDTGYGIFSGACEAFPSYCKTGLAESYQVVWLYEKVKSVVNEALHNVGNGYTYAGVIAAKEYAKEGAKVFLERAQAAASMKVCAAEKFERLVNGTTAVGVGVLVFFESCACVFDLRKIYGVVKEGKMSQQNFITSAFLRVGEALAAAGLAEGGDVPEKVSGPQGSRGVDCNATDASSKSYFGSFFGGLFGSTSRRYIGVYLGSPMARALATSIGTNDRPVKSIEDLNSGDQVVFYGNLLHPRHHAIVVECDKGKGIVRVVHNTYQNGVGEESVEFRPPVYRLVYDKNDCYPPDEVIKRARSKIGDETYKYSLAFNNCKSFGEWCKLKSVTE